MINEIGQLVKQAHLDICVRSCFLNHLHDRTIIRIERDKIACPQDPVVPLLDKGHLFGRINPQITQSRGMQIGPFGLAATQGAIDDLVQR